MILPTIKNRRRGSKLKDFKVMKFMGDDMYSYAVFRKSEVKGLRSPIVSYTIKPLYSGCGRSEAYGYADTLQRELDEKKEKR